MPTKREAMTAKAISLIGDGYIYGATGWVCTQSRLDQQARQYPQYADLIYRYGPRWFGKPCYDCAQLTRVVAQAAGVGLPSGSNSQWRAGGVWKEKGTIDAMPNEAGLFVFTMNDGRMTHTAVTIGGGQAVDARGHAYGVVRRDLSSASYTHWARLNVDYEAPASAQNPPGGNETRRTLRRGASGEDVREVQRLLLSLGYDLGRSGVDGKYGSSTQEAVRSFQHDNGLSADGIVGAATWQMLDAMAPADGGNDEKSVLLSGAMYTAFVRGMSEARREGETMLVSLPREDYEQMMELIRPE